MKGQLDEREQELEQLKSKLTEVENGSKELIAVLSESATIVQSALKVKVLSTPSTMCYVPNTANCHNQYKPRQLTVNLSLIDVFIKVRGPTP